jgi:hypothetical protein
VGATAPIRAYEATGAYAKAEPLYQRALAIREKALGLEHPDTSGRRLAPSILTPLNRSTISPGFTKPPALTRRRLIVEGARRQIPRRPRVQPFG